MSKTTKAGFSVGLLLVGVLAGAAGVHAFQLVQRSRFMNTGLFTVAPGEVVRFNASLDDNRDAPPATVLMQLVDARGNTVARQEVKLEPGQSATLAFRQAGRFRAHAEVLEPDVALGSRRIVMGTVEISSLTTTTTVESSLGMVANLELLESTLTRFVCSSSDGSGNGRLPD